VRTALKPFFKGGVIDKEAYKEIMRKAVPKVFSMQELTVCQSVNVHPRSFRISEVRQ